MVTIADRPPRRPELSPAAKLSVGLIVLMLMLLSFSGASSAQVCLGDCDRDRRVTVDEVTTGIAMALGQRPVECPAFGRGPGWEVDVAQLTEAVDHLLSGCGVTSLEALERERQANLAKWRAAAIENYQMRYERVCYCLPPSEFDVTVRGGEVVALRRIDTGEQVEPTYGVESVDQLFERLAAAIADRAVYLSVSYHPVLGYPLGIGIDYRSEVADEEIGMLISELAADE